MIAVIATVVLAEREGDSRGYGAGRQDEADYEARLTYRANRMTEGKK
jgi:hypothetical protein